MLYKFNNRAVLEIPKNFIITITNPLVYYLIIKMNYIALLLITKLMFISIEFEIFRETSCTYDGSAKPGKETKSI